MGRMARRSTQAPATPVSMKPEKVITIIEGLLQEAQANSVSWHRFTPEAKGWAQSARGILIQGFGSEDPLVEAFSSEWESFVFVGGENEAKQRLIFAQHFPRVLAVLRSAVQQLQWQLPDSSQVFQPAGSQHDSFVEIRKMVVIASSELLIVDSYVDHTLWMLLSNVAGSVKIRILTDQMKGDFRLEGKKFAAQHGNIVDVRRGH